MTRRTTASLALAAVATFAASALVLAESGAIPRIGFLAVNSAVQYVRIADGVRWRTDPQERWRLAERRDNQGDGP